MTCNFPNCLCQRDNPPLCKNPNVNAIHSQLFQKTNTPKTDTPEKALIKKLADALPKHRPDHANISWWGCNLTYGEIRNAAKNNS